MFVIFLVQIGFVLFSRIQTKSIENKTENNKSLLSTISKLEERINNLTQMVEKATFTKISPVLFFVRLSKTTSLNINSIVKFDEIGINEGGHFNPGDGIFVAPISGVYQFSWTVLTYTNNVVETELRVDNEVQDTLNIHLSPSELHNSGTKIVICKVKKGDHVWIQTSSVYSLNYLDVVNAAKSSFSGVLLYTMHVN